MDRQMFDIYFDDCLSSLYGSIGSASIEAEIKEFNGNSVVLQTNSISVSKLWKALVMAPVTPAGAAVRFMMISLTKL